MSAEVQDERVTVRVLFFGAAKDVTEQREVTLKFDRGTKAADAFEEIMDSYPGLRRFGRSLLFAVNQQYAAKAQEIKDGDELAVFPPVSGGSDE
jgi:MoaE-MoaD fusion protein